MSDIKCAIELVGAAIPPVNYTIATPCVEVSMCFVFSITKHLSHKNVCVQALSHTQVEVVNSDGRTKADVSR